MIVQGTIYGSTLVEQSKELLRVHEPAGGYSLMFSGGADSQAAKLLCDQAGVKYEAHYHNTSIDPPEIVYHVRECEVREHAPAKTMWHLLPLKMYPPTRQQRWCCELLKHFDYPTSTVLGIRAEESVARKKRGMIEGCPESGKITLKPLFRWSRVDVMDYLEGYGQKICSIYSEGWMRGGVCRLSPLEQPGEGVPTLAQDRRWVAKRIRTDADSKSLRSEGDNMAITKRSNEVVHARGVLLRGDAR